MYMYARTCTTCRYNGLALYTYCIKKARSFSNCISHSLQSAFVLLAALGSTEEDIRYKVSCLRVYPYYMCLHYFTNVTQIAAKSQLIPHLVEALLADDSDVKIAAAR